MADRLRKALRGQPETLYPRVNRDTLTEAADLLEAAEGDQSGLSERAIEHLRKEGETYPGRVDGVGAALRAYAASDTPQISALARSALDSIGLGEEGD